MTLNNYSWRAIRGLLCLATVLAMVSVASAEWKEKVLYSFQSVPDGATPVGAVVFDKAGNLYGTTRDADGDFGPDGAVPTLQEPEGVIGTARPGTGTGGTAGRSGNVPDAQPVTRAP